MIKIWIKIKQWLCEHTETIFEPSPLSLSISEYRICCNCEKEWYE